MANPIQLWPRATGGSSSSTSGWQRPSDWLPVNVTPGSQVIKILMGVDQSTYNWVGIRVTGAYTVDWGDGTTPQNIGTNTIATHNYDWANVSSGTLTSEGLRQAILTVTPQAAGTISTFEIGSSAGPTSPIGSQKVLDIVVGPDLAMFDPSQGAATIQLRRVVFTRSQTALQMKSFANTYSLRAIEGDSIVLLGTSSFPSLFSNCYALGRVPAALSMPGTDLSVMFNNCFSLVTGPSLTLTGAATNISSMFQNAQGMISLPMLNTATVTNFSAMFAGCYSLTGVPSLNTAAGTNFSSMFSGCYLLLSVPSLNTAAGTNFSSMFNNCYSLTTLPTLNTGAGTNFSNMFQANTSLTVVPALNMSNCSSTANASGMFTNCSVMTSCLVYGMRFSFSVANTALGTAALNTLFTNLGTASGAQTITITSCPGSATCDRSIATGKGWAVSG